MIGYLLSLPWPIIPGPIAVVTKTSKLCQFDLCKWIQRRLVSSAQVLPDKGRRQDSVFVNVITWKRTWRKPHEAILYTEDLKDDLLRKDANSSLILWRTIQSVQKTCTGARMFLPFYHSHVNINCQPLSKANQCSEWVSSRQPLVPIHFSMAWTHRVQSHTYTLYVHRESVLIRTVCHVAPSRFYSSLEQTN